MKRLLFMKLRKSNSMKACQKHLSLTKAQIKIIKGTCSHGTKGPMKINQALPQNLCPLLFYSLYPYYFTFSRGGKFKWVKKGEGVIVRCPQPKGIVVEVKKKNKGIVTKVIKNKGQCPLKYKMGQRFDINEKTIRFCPYALYLTIPYLKKQKSPLLINCSCPAGEASLEITNLAQSTKK